MASKSAKSDAGTETAAKRIADEIPAELVKGNSWTEEQLREVTTFEDALRLTEETFGVIAAADEVLGDGFTLLRSDQKDLLTGRPMLLMEWSFYEGDFGGNFAAIRAVVQNPDKSVSRYIFNDGSAGICEQLARYTKRTGITGGLVVRQGLRRSDYTYTDEEGNERPASTYYLDVSA